MIETIHEMGQTVQNLGTIAELCRVYAAALDAMEDLAEQIRDERRAAVKRRLRRLKTCIAGAAAAKTELRAAITANPGLFDKPRTRAFEGIKVGWRKLPGRFEFADEARVIARVRERLADREAAIIRVKHSLDKAALKRLDGRELKAIGVSLVESDDEVVISEASSDLNALIDALLDDAVEETAA